MLSHQDHTFSPKDILEALESLLTLLPPGDIDPGALKRRQIIRLRTEIEVVIGRLQALLKDLDPIKSPQSVFDPSDANTVGKFIAQTLLAQSRLPLDLGSKFYGAGVYALYYNGTFDAYAPLIGSETPIYVGKADPQSPQAITPIEQGTALWGRLKDHKKSIDAATTSLEAKDFDVRFLVVRSAWQGTAEHYLIDRFVPVWNKETRICYGFGKHGDKPTTRKNERSPWDTLHPGRHWAGEGNVDYHLSVDQIKEQIAKHFLENPPVSELH